MRRNTYPSGFTLVELVVIIVLLGILSIYAAPRFLHSQDFATRGYFDELLQASRYAQKLAVASNCEARITIAANSFTLEQPAAANQCGNPTTWQTVSLPGIAPPYSAPGGVTVTAGTGPITFNGEGQASAGPIVTVSGNGNSFRFQVYPATGFVRRL